MFYKILTNFIRESIIPKHELLKFEVECYDFILLSIITYTFYKIWGFYKKKKINKQIKEENRSVTHKLLSPSSGVGQQTPSPWNLSSPIHNITLQKKKKKKTRVSTASAECSSSFAGFVFAVLLNVVDFGFSCCDLLRGPCREWWGSAKN